MKMRYGKRIMAIASAALLGILAAGCGKTEDNTTAEKEFVYVPEYQKIQLENGMNSANVIGDNIYFLTGNYDEEAQVYKQQLGVLKVGETTPEFITLPIDPNANLSGIQTDVDGNLVAVVTTDIYEEGSGEGATAVPAEEGAADAEKEVNAEADTTGVEETTDAEADAEEENADAEEDTEEVVTEEVSSSSVITMGTARMSGMAVATISSSGNDVDYVVPISQKRELYTFSPSGEVISTVDLTEVLDENSYVQFSAIDKDGNIYLSLEQKVIVLNKEGKELFRFEVENWINSMFVTKGGEVLLAYYGAEQMEVHKIDVAGKKVGETVQGLMVGNGWGNSTYVKGNETDLLFSSGNDLYTYNMGDAEAQKVLNWIDADINSDDVRAFAALEDGRILAITTSWNGADNTSTTELIYLTKKKGSEVPEKKIITYGTMSLGWDVKKQIIEFNKTNPEYRIEIKEYLNGSTEDAYSLSQEQMNADIMGGKGPDMIDVTGGNLQKYAAKGILEDLYPYMDADETVKREDYVPSILKAYEMDGKLYAISPRFYIQTVLAKTADVGERTSITPDELMQMTEELPEDMKLYEYASKDSVLMTNTMMNMDQYVNWNTGECKFNSEEFIKALEFANQFETEINYDGEGPTTPELLREGKLLMVMGSISSIEEYQMYTGMFGEPFTFIGYPTTKENGSFIGGSDSLLAMNSKSKNKDGVWQFIKSRMDKAAFEEGAQMGRFGFPILKSALEDQFAKAMEEEYYEDAEGKKHKQPKTTWGFDGFSVEIYAATEEEVEAVRNLIASTDTLYQYDQQINTIISEETKAFFEGQKSAKDVADIIQSRVQIYVNENR